MNLTFQHQLENLKNEKYSHLLKIVFGDMHVISKFNKALQYLFCVVDIYSKYAWVVPLKDKKSITISNAFQKFLDKSVRKPNKIRR